MPAQQAHTTRKEQRRVSARVTLPPGCYGLDMADGTRYNANRDGRVLVADQHAAAIRSGYYGQTGVMVASEEHRLGTRHTRECTTCRPTRRWNAWNTRCPRCGAPTTLTEEASTP
jgi:hypothetical protein